MPKTILVVATFNNHFDFFCRLMNPLKELDYQLVFLTNKYSIFREAEKKGLRIYKINKSNRQEDADVTRVFENISGELPEKNCKIRYSSVYSTIERLNNEYKFDIIFTWGGVRLIESAANNYASKNQIKKLCFELGNFPGKLFADPLGANANSILIENKDLLLDLDVNESDYQSWKNNFISGALKSHTVPQSSSIARIDIKKNIYDLTGYLFLNFIKNRPVITYTKIKNKIFNRLGKFVYDRVEFDNQRYIFYPMQVSDDAQLILNSEVDNIKALEKVSDYARVNNLELFVKPHPAEVRFDFIKSIERLKERLNFKFVNGNTIEIMMKAEKVFTINSTAGIQAMILGKDVTCFGRALFKDFTQKHLKSYICNYLLDIDFWGNGPVDIENTEKLIRRSKLGFPNN